MSNSNLKKMREYRDLSQAQLSKRSGVPVRTIQSYEQGFNDINKAQVITALKLSEALGCEIYDIINPRG